MRIRQCVVAIVATVLVAPRLLGQPTPLSDSSFVSSCDAALHKLTRVQEEVRDMHPFLQTAHPVAVVEGDDLYIFAFDSVRHGYTFAKKVPAPFPMPRGIRASFPLDSYGGRPTCVVSREVFDSMQGYATVLHEFIHCTQFLTCENELKQGLRIAKEAALSHKYSWEINHPFPYEDPAFVRSYARYLEALATGDTGSSLPLRRALRRQLSDTDREYMVWVEWKEGFARYIENEVRSRYGLEANRGGMEQPYNRVAFYYGGETFIRRVFNGGRSHPIDVRALFSTMMF